MPVTFVPAPSGRLVFANDLRSLTGHVKNHNVNTKEGTYKQSLEYCVYGMGFVPTGNSSPDVIRSGDDIEITTKRGQGTVLGGIDTSLWWVCAMDEETFLRRCEILGEDPASFDAFVVEVKPGVHMMTLENTERDAPGVLSRIRWVDLTLDDMSFLKEPDFSSAAHFENSHIWKEIQRRPFGLSSNVEDIFTVLGNGFKWHRGQLCDLNGHEQDAPFAKPLPDDDDVSAFWDRIPELPGFKPGLSGTESSYPLHDDYPKLGGAPLNADPNDLAVGMMFAKTFLNQEIRLIGKNVTAEKTNKSQAVLRRELATAMKIADSRGLFTDGTMDRIFSEVLVAWKLAAPAPRHEDGMTP